jgi:hypothetical protein
MKRNSLLTHSLIAKLIYVLEITVLLLVCTATILDWLDYFRFSPDSTGYISASVSLVRSGKLEEYINLTDWYSDPVVHPYTEQPPGFPLFLAPFIAILRDPIISVAVAQSVSIVLYYVFAYLISLRLNFTPILRITALLLFAFFDPFISIHKHLWTETLFIALSMAAGWVAISLLTGSNRRSEWITLLALLALSSTIRFIGVANIALIALIILRRDTMRAAWRLLTRRFVSLGFAIGGGLLVLLSLLADLLSIAKPGIGPMQWRGIAIGSVALLIGLAHLLLTRSMQAKPKALARRTPEIPAATWALAAVASTIVPVLLWLIRNRVLYGNVALINRFFESLYFDKLAVPLGLVWEDYLSVRGVPQPVVATVVVALLLLPLIRSSDHRKAAHVAILGAFLAHLSLALLLPLIATIQPAGLRYLSPALAFGILGILSGLQHAIESLRPRRWAPVLLVLPLAFLALSNSVSFGDVHWNTGKVNFPVERQLWKELDSVEWIHSSTHFYADSYYHQIFCYIPQGMIWESAVLEDADRLRDLLSRGQNPFILLRASSGESTIVENTISTGDIKLKRMTFPELDYVLYYLQE